MRLLLVLLSSFSVAAVAATPWTFDKVRVLSELTDANIETEVYNLAGGTVDILVSGRPFGLCPGGFERLRFVWRFDKDISRLSPGDRFGARLEVRKAGSTPPCTNGIASRAFMEMMGSSGASAPWPENERGVLDGNRFLTYRGDRATIERTADDIVEITGLAIDPKRPNGWFQFSIATTAGYLRYCYIYRPDTSGSSPAPLSVGGTWYREGDRSRPASVEQNGAALAFINEFGNRSRGRFDGADVIATDWNNLRGRLVDGGSKIEWGNGSSWSRVGNSGGLPSLGGTWYREGDRSRPASVEQNGAALAFINEFGNRSRGRFDGADVIAIDWNNLRGRLLDNYRRIAWANNSNWAR